MSHREVTNRDVGLGAALVAGAAGVVSGEPTLLIAAAIGLVYAAYEAFTGSPEPDLAVERSVSTTSPLPGETVEVTVTLRNHGTDALPDVRVVDGVPSALGVVEGTPRHGTALEPDQQESFSYTVEARRGEHSFRETTVVCRNLTGDAEYQATVDVATDVVCSVDVDSIDLPPETIQRAGRIETDESGEGISFHAIREYQPSDPLNRIDWNRFARTDELATVEFAATRSASVVVLVDTRLAYAADPRAPTATQLSKYAAERIASSLLADNNSVGAALYDGGEYLAPRTDRTQQLRLRRFLLYERPPEAAPSDLPSGGFDGRAFFEVNSPDSAAVPDGGAAIETLDRRFPDDAQVIFCTPLLDNRARDAASRLSALGRAVTVVSPDVTTGDTPGHTVERINRAARVRNLRGTVRMVDWSPSEPISNALARASERWSR